MTNKPTHETVLQVGDLTFHVVQWGEQGEPIICVHGLTASAFLFQALADELSSDHRVFAYDLRGRGESEKPASGYGIPAHAADLAGLIDALGLARPVVAGHSLGGLISLYFAAHYPAKLRKLILLDAGGPLPWSNAETRPAWLTTSVNRLGTPVPSFTEYRARLQAAPFLGPYWNQYFDFYYEHDVDHSPDGSVKARALRSAALEDLQYMEEHGPLLVSLWPQITVPALLLRAGQSLVSPDDQLVPEATASTIRQSIRDCRVINYPDLNHYTIMLGVQPEPNQDIRNFVG
jgi:pimeloyl-ACP methyl ester carboxylesterase